MDSWSANRMTEMEYDAERQRIRATYGDTKGSAGARFEQELSRLFAVAKSRGWTQEDLAKKEGKNRTYISRLLCFGAFLDFVPSGHIDLDPLDKVTERQFRRYWERTDKDADDRERWAEVVRLMESEITLRKAKPREPIRPRLIELFGDGQWHKIDTLVKAIGEDEPYVTDALKDIIQGQSKIAKCERKQVGKSMEYRIFRKRKESREIFPDELKEKLTPIIQKLMIEGKKNAATASPTSVLVAAHDLKKLLDSWVE